MTDHVAAIVIGAGVVGLACARALARAGREVIVLERHEDFGTEVSARNSEVIHAGIHYAPGSLKARLCVEGRRDLYEFCEQHGVKHRRCGKLIVAATPVQEARLEEMRRRAAANGVDDLQPLSAAEVRALEPELACVAALLSPSTGIVDSHGLMLALLGDAERHGAVFVPHSPVVAAERCGDSVEVLTGGADRSRLRAEIVVNAAGLSAPAVAGSIAGFPADKLPRAFLAKGSYFSLSSRAPFSRLVYPVPEPGGLGVHLTLDLAGRARFGPDVEWIESPDYRVDPERAKAFYEAIRRYWPGLPNGSLQPAYAGIRPKIAGPGEADADFMIQGPETHGVPGLINLFGIESPGLTSCLAIAGEVGRRLGVTISS